MEYCKSNLIKLKKINGGKVSKYTYWILLLPLLLTCVGERERRSLEVTPLNGMILSFNLNIVAVQLYKIQVYSIVVHNFLKFMLHLQLL